MKKIILFSLLLLPFALHSQSKDAVKFYNSGVEAERTSNYNEAIFYYSMAIDLDGNYADALTKRGDIYRKMKNYGKAKSDYFKVTGINPKNETVLLSLSQVNYDLKDYDGAIASSTKLVELNSFNADAYYIRGNSYSALKDVNNAASDYSKVLEINPSHADASDKLNKLKSENRNKRSYCTSANC
jgi:tetratricopeptide (TPR) repeat protein